MLAETTDDLLLVFRREVYDINSYLAAGKSDASSLWKDDEIYRYMTEAADALARDTDGLYEVARIGFNAGDATVPLPDHILKIREARLVNANLPIEIANANSPRAIVRDYGVNVLQTLFTTAAGRPNQIVCDYDVGAVRFDSIPTDPDLLELQCTVTIADPLESGEDVPFTAVPDQRLMLEYMKSRAYRKQDADTEDLVRAKDAENFYNVNAVERALKLRLYRRAAGTIRMEW